MFGNRARNLSKYGTTTPARVCWSMISDTQIA